MKATIKSEPGMPINMNAFPTGQMQHLEHVQKERSLKKRRLDLEKEELQLGKQELQLKRRELKFEEEEAAIERVGKMAAVVEDEDEVTFLSEKQVNRDAQNSMTNEGVEVELAASKDNQSTIVAKSFVDGTARESSKSVSETCRNEQVATAEDTRASQPPKQESSKILHTPSTW
jgi:predicted acyl esterase